MRARRLCLAVALLVVFAAAPAALAQQVQSLEVEDVDTSAHPQVTFTVTAPQELVGQDLTEAFTVTEAGAERPVTVQQVPTDDLEVVLLVDTSGSMGDQPMAAARDAASDFVSAMPQGVRIAVVEFSDQPAVARSFSTNQSGAVEALQALESGGNTALYDGVLASLDQFGSSDDTRQAIVVLSDGGDTFSDADLEVARDALLESSATLFAIELQTAESDPDALVTLASATGGRVVSTDDPAGLGALYDDIASQLVNLYAVSYESQSAGRTAVRIDLEADEVSAFSAQQVRLPIPPSPDEPETEDGTVSVPAIVSRVVDPGWLGEPWVAYTGAGVMFAAIAVGLLALLAPRPRRVRLDGPARASSDEPTSTLTSITQRLTGLAERRLERRGQSRPLALQLERAGIDLRPGEFTVLAVGGAIVLAMLGFFLLSLFGLIVGAAFGIVAARVVLRYLAERRRSQFAEQLPDTLQLMSGSLRTGYGIMQALDAVVREADDPTASEFRRLLMENRLGRDLNESLTAMAERIGLEDFDWVVQAINIHRDVGGDLADVLDRVAETIRERDQIRRQIKALSADGRLSAIILVGLPIFMAVAVSIVQPGYLGELTTSPIGWVMLVMGTVLMVIGTIWVRRLVRLVF